MTMPDSEHEQQSIGIDAAALLVSRAPDALNPSALRLMALLGSGAALPEQLTALAQYVESYEPSILCSIMLADETRRTLVLSAAPSLPEAWARHVAEIEVAEGAGSCGTAAARVAAVIVPDVRLSALWARYATAAIESGLYACWSVPFVDANGLLLGTIALYYRAPRTPSDDERQLIDVAADLATLVTCRHREDASRRVGMRRLRELIQRTAAPILVKRHGRVVYMNGSAVTLLGRSHPAGVVDLPIADVAAQASAAQLDRLCSGSETVGLLDAEGHRIPARATAMPEAGPNPESVVLTFVDLREQFAIERQLQDSAEEQWARIANDLNNQVCQQLAGIEYLIASVTPTAHPDSAATLRLAQQQLQHVRQETSLLATWLTPPTPTGDGVETALRTLAEDISRETGKAVSLDIGPGVDAALHQTDRATVARILARLVRHAAHAPAAQRVTIVAHAVSEGSRLTVSTNTPALAPEGASSHFGSLRHLAWLVGSVLRFESDGVESSAMLTILL